MPATHKTPSVQSYRLMVYHRPLHPELFRVADQRTFTHTEHETELWLTPGGHVMRFQSGNKTIIEAVVDQEQPVPQTGIIETVPCLGERDIETTTESGIHYVSSIQSETLSENLFNATLNEMHDFAIENNALVLNWKGNDGGSHMSIVDVQTFRREVHAQSYHMIASAGFVLRTQTIFELI